jgi:hypothetical protein
VSTMHSVEGWKAYSLNYPVFDDAASLFIVFMLAVGALWDTRRDNLLKTFNWSRLLVHMAVIIDALM